MKNSWFQVDKGGLRKLLDERGKSFVLYELVQNAWDTDAHTVSITLEKLPGRPLAKLVVTDDDPDGFHDLAHAYTLFAESEKKGDPTKRGRFNLGEKLVLALCTRAYVQSTTGAVAFHEDGTMSQSRRKTRVGSVFQATIRMNQAEFDEVCAEIFRIIPPEVVTTTFNGEEICPFTDEDCVASFDTTLPTVISNEEGVLTRTRRKTMVRVYEADGPGWIYEMGIPVVETGDRFHVDVHQKVPLNMDRDNVPPGYLKKVRAEVLNRTASRLTGTQSSESWVTNALESPDVSDEAVGTTLDLRFGKKRAIFDPTDPEANMALTSRGYTVISGGSLPKGAWTNIRRSKAAVPSGRLAPTPKPYSSNPNAPQVKLIHPDNWTTGMKEVAEILKFFAKELSISDNLSVQFVLPTQRNWTAAWGGGFDFNVSRLGRKWFQNWHKHPRALLDLMVHEFAHHKAANHLQHEFHEACTDYGAQVALLCLQNRRIPHFQRLRAGNE